MAFKSSGIIILGGAKDTKGLKGDEFKAKVAENLTAAIEGAGGTVPAAPVMGKDILSVEYITGYKEGEPVTLRGHALSEEFAEVVGQVDFKNNYVATAPKEFVLNKDLAAKVYEATKNKTGKEFGEALKKGVADLGIGASFGSIVKVSNGKGGCFSKIAVGGEGFGKDQREGNGEYMTLASKDEISYQKELDDKAKEKKAQEKTPEK